MTAPNLLLPDYDDFSSTEHTLRFLWQLLQATDAKIVIEAGTYYAHFTNIAASVVKPRGGHVYTADTVNYCRFKSLQDNGLVECVDFIHGDFTDIANRFPEILGQVDFAFIDSGAPFAYQWEDGCRFRHYELAKSWLAPGGIIVTDDIGNPDWEGAERIRAEAGILLPHIGHGLALVQKPL